MRVYEASEIRNVALVGHGHAGKTSLAAGLLYTSGATNRLTRADEGNTITDYDEDRVPIPRSACSISQTLPV